MSSVAARLGLFVIVGACGGQPARPAASVGVAQPEPPPAAPDRPVPPPPPQTPGPLPPVTSDLAACEAGKKLDPAVRANAAGPGAYIHVTLVAPEGEWPLLERGLRAFVHESGKSTEAVLSTPTPERLVALCADPNIRRIERRTQPVPVDPEPQ